MNTHNPTRIGIIDLGSNTARLVVMQAVPGYAYRLEDQVREVVRLRRGMTDSGLSREAMMRAFSTLRLFKSFCDSTQVDILLPVATSAVREAANGPLFVERVRDEIGISLQVLDGEHEAYYDTIGALNEVAMIDGFVIDIGGGSVQLGQVQDRRYARGASATLGALALTERFIVNDPVEASEYEAIEEEIARQLDTIWWVQGNGATVVGLGGTIRNLARIEIKRSGYPLNTLHGFCLDRDSVLESIQLLRELPLDERRCIAGLNPDRADIILPGAMVLVAMMERLNVDDVTISENGLREGVFFEMFWEHLAYPVIPDVRTFGVLNMARNYQYQEAHSNHVRFLAGRLFDQFAPLHNYGIEARELLDAAALLHDLGRVMGYSSHHKHSQTLIEYNGLPGFSPREIALIGLLARYHRKGNPDIDDYELLLDDEDEVMLIRLSALLRMAECLERGRNARVDDVSVTWGDDYVRLTLITDDYPAVELWQARSSAAPLMAQAFERRVVLDSVAAPLEWPDTADLLPGEMGMEDA